MILYSRIERSTEQAIEAILEGLRWLELEADEPPLFQSQRADRHCEVAEQLLAAGRAYRCYASQAELEEMRQRARAEGRPTRYDGRWRDRDPADAPRDIAPVVRLKAPQDGETAIEDLVQGEVRVRNDQLDDMVLLRSDGTPTYMHAVVVDDLDMGITHVIRGDDHLTNAFRQTQLYQAIGVEPPRFAHIPLIYGPDGKKMSKRHGALSVTEYRQMGFLPEAMRNYLLRLGWGHGDEEIVPTPRAAELFDLEGVGRSPARFDFVKLGNLNGHYLREAEDERLLELVTPWLDRPDYRQEEARVERLRAGMTGLKQRARTLVEVADAAGIYLRDRPLPLDKKAAGLLDAEARRRLATIRSPLADLSPWDEAALETLCRSLAEAEGLGFGKLAQPLRAALTGTSVSPGLFEVMVVLGRDETLARLDDAAAGRNPPPAD